MIDCPYENLFREDSVSKQWTITVTDTSNGNRNTVAVIHNEDLLDNSLEISETLSSDGLNFGRCEPSRIKFTVYNTFASMKGCELRAEVSVGENEPFLIGIYKVNSDTPTADRYHREVEAYDFLYDINNADVGPWYEGLEFPISIRKMRDNLFSYLGYEQEEIDLPNDNIQVNKTVNTENGMSGSAVIAAICETNAAFGHVTRDNKFRYVMLKQLQAGTYPRDDLYPKEDLYPTPDVSDGYLTKEHWMNLEYEDFDCKPIDGIYVLDSEGEIFAQSGECQNPYELKQNFLLYEMDDGTAKDVPLVRASIVSTASQFIGRTYDSKNNIIFITDYYGSEQNKRINYCCMFVWDIYRMCRVPEYFMGGKKSASCTEVLNFYKQYYPTHVHTDISRCKQGDLVFYQFDTDSKADHIGIFESQTSNTTFYAIEGNTSNKEVGVQYDSGWVMRKNRNINKVMAFVSIEFPEDTERVATELQTICDNLLPYIKGFAYTPFTMDCLANPCIEVGDRIRVNSRDKIVYSYCFERRMTGIQAMMDNIESDGVEDRTETMTSTNDDIERLKTKVLKDAQFNRASIKELTATTATITKDLNAYNVNITNRLNLLSGSVTDIDGRVNVNSQAIVTVNGQIDVQDGKITALGKDVVSVQNGLVTIKSDYVKTSELNAAYINSLYSGTSRFSANIIWAGSIIMSYAGSSGLRDYSMAPISYDGYLFIGCKL